MTMVYCTKCSTQNEEDSEYCIECGASLKVSREKSWESRVDEWGEEIGRRAEKECFGFPHGGAILGLIFGTFVIIVGISLALGVNVGLVFVRWGGALLAISIGILMIAGAIYGLSRRRS